MPNATLSQEMTPLPEDLYSDLRNFHPSSYEFKEGFTAANELAREAGYAALTLEQVFPPVELIPPAGFSNEHVVPNGAVLPAEQFKVIKSLHANGPEIIADSHRLTTDSGIKINYIDLRPHMSAAVQHGGPSEKRQIETLDRAFLKDLKFFAEMGHGKNTVTIAHGVNYTKVGGTKMRAYWMSATNKSADNAPTLVRLADCGNEAQQGDLYRRVFGKIL